MTQHCGTEHSDCAGREDLTEDHYEAICACCHHCDWCDGETDPRSHAGGGLRLHPPVPEIPARSLRPAGHAHAPYSGGYRHTMERDEAEVCLDSVIGCRPARIVRS